jgi:hypothetical protein
MLHLPQGTLGSMMSFDTKVICIQVNSHNLNPLYFLSFMLHPQLGTPGLPKPMTGSNVLIKVGLSLMSTLEERLAAQRFE